MLKTRDPVRCNRLEHINAFWNAQVGQLLRQASKVKLLKHHKIELIYAPGQTRCKNISVPTVQSVLNSVFLIQINPGNSSSLPQYQQFALKNYRIKETNPYLAKFVQSVIKYSE
jgi:hypothetical protein